MAELTVTVPNYEFRRRVVKAMEHEHIETICQLIVDLIEEIAGDNDAPEHLQTLVETIQAFIPEEEA